MEAENIYQDTTFCPVSLKLGMVLPTIPVIVCFLFLSACSLATDDNRTRQAEASGSGTSQQKRAIALSQALAKTL